MKDEPSIITLPNHDKIDSEQSVLSVVSDAIREAVLAIPPEVAKLTSLDLDKKFKINMTTKTLRTAFWIEYNRNAAANNGAFSPANIYAGICSRQFFYDIVLKDSVRVAYIMCPPTNYTAALEALLDRGLDRLAEIIAMPLENPKTKRPDPAIAKVILSAIQMIDTRVKGSVVQRIEQKNLNVQVKATAGELPRDLQGLETKLRELEAKATQIIVSEEKKTLLVDSEVISPDEEEALENG